jgi:hypothetical protein
MGCSATRTKTVSHLQNRVKARSGAPLIRDLDEKTAFLAVPGLQRITARQKGAIALLERP